MRKKIKEDSRTWRKRLRELLELYAPPIVACTHCGSPRHKGFCCMYCGKE